MAETVGEIYIKERLDSSGLDREVRDSMARAAKEADKGGEEAGKNFGESFGKGVEDSNLGGAFDDLRKQMDRLAEEKFGRVIDQIHEMTDTERAIEDTARAQRELADSIRSTSEEARRADLRRFNDEMRQLWANTNQNVSTLRRMTNGLRDFGRIASTRFLGGMDDDFRRTTVRFGGFLGEAQKFGYWIRAASIDIRNWRNGMLAVTDTLLGFSKVMAKAVLLLGPLAAGISETVGAITALGGSTMVGAIGVIGALGPAAVAAGAGFYVLSEGLKAFGKHATAAQKAVVKPITDQFKAMNKAVQGTLFANITQQAKLLTPVLNTTKTAMVGVAAAVRDTVTSLLRVLGPTGQAGKSFKTLMAALAPLDRTLGKALVSTISGIVGTLAAAVPTSGRFAKALQTLTARFAAFANSAKGRATLEDYFNRGYTAASKIMRILGTLGKALFKVLDIGDRAAGESLLDGMLKSLQKFDRYVSSSRGRAELTQWFKDSRVFVTHLMTALGALGHAFGALDTKQTRGQLNNILDTVTKLLDGFTKLVNYVQGQTGPFDPIGKSAGAAWGDIKKLLKTVTDLMVQIGKKGGDQAMVSLLDLVGGAARTANEALKLLGPVLTTMLGVFSKLPAPIRDTFLALYAMRRIGAFAGLTAFATGFERVAGLGLTRVALGINAVGTAVGRLPAMGRVGSGIQTFANRINNLGTAVGGFGRALSGAFAGGIAGMSVGSLIEKGGVTGMMESILGGAGAGAIAGGSVGGLPGAGIGAVIGGISSAIGHLMGMQSKQHQAAMANWAEQQQAIQDVTAAIEEDNNALGKNYRQLVISKLQKGGGLDAATTLGIDPGLVTDATLGVASAQTKLSKIINDFQRNSGSLTKDQKKALETLIDTVTKGEDAAGKGAQGAVQKLAAAKTLWKASLGEMGLAVTSLGKNSAASRTEVEKWATSTVQHFGDVATAGVKAGKSAETLGTNWQKSMTDMNIAADKQFPQFRAQIDKAFQAIKPPKPLVQKLEVDAFSANKKVADTARALLAKWEIPIKKPLSVTVDAVFRGVGNAQQKINTLKQKTAAALKADPSSANTTINTLRDKMNHIIQTKKTSLKADDKEAVATARGFLSWLDRQAATVDVKANMSPAELAVANWKPPAVYVPVIAQINRVGYYGQGGQTPPKKMTGGIIDTPQVVMAGERGMREAIVPLDLPLHQVHPEVRQMAALLRGAAGSKYESMGNAPATKVQNVTMNVYPNAADPKAVSTSLLNQLAARGR